MKGKFKVSSKATNPFKSGPGAELIWAILYPAFLSGTVLAAIVFWKIGHIGYISIFAALLLFIYNKLRTVKPWQMRPSEEPIDFQES